ncbi:MAG TPA: hypothetical protein V6C97_29975 [Oculatellaceae cyanobacterium]
MDERTSRRKILQAVAALPAASLGLMNAAVAAGGKSAEACSSGEAQSDLTPGSAANGSNKAPAAIFHEEDLVDVWACLPFIIKGGAPDDTRSDERGYAIKLPSGDVVAYARGCKMHGCKFDYSTSAAEHLDNLYGGVDKDKLGAVLSCKCHGSVFDVTANGAVIAGPEREPLVRYRVKRCHDKICVIV